MYRTSTQNAKKHIAGNVIIYLHHEIKLDTLSRAKNVPLLAAGKKCTLPMARIGPAKPDVIDFVIDLLRACRLAKYSSAAVRT